MDKLISKLVKVLSSTIIVRIMSYPPFTIEIFLASIVCVVHILLLFEINTLVRRTNAQAATRIRTRHSIKEEETCSFHSLVTLQTTQVFQKKPEIYQRTHLYAPVAPQRLQKKFSRQNFGWTLSKGDSILRHNYDDRVEHLLSISPSEYVRRDKERKSREQGLRSCLQSLTSLLQKALTNDAVEIRNISKEEIKRSLNALRENFENQLNNDYQLSNFPTQSLQSLIDRATSQKVLQQSLSPNLISSIYHASNVAFTQSTTDLRKKMDEDEKNHSSVENLSIRSNESLSELFRKNSDLFRNAKRPSRGILPN